MMIFVALGQIDDDAPARSGSVCTLVDTALTFLAASRSIGLRAWSTSQQEPAAIVGPDEPRSGSMLQLPASGVVHDASVEREYKADGANHSFRTRLINEDRPSEPCSIRSGAFASPPPG
ncbi:MAG: hypothetical protein R2695_21465 [Acidimicrobiales bacterium]